MDERSGSRSLDADILNKRLEYLQKERQDVENRLLANHDREHKGGRDTATIEREHREQNVWEKINHAKFLQGELYNQFGGDARKVAVENYGESRQGWDEGRPRLIDQIIGKRNREFSHNKESQLLHLKVLNEERYRLLEERQKLQDKKRALNLPASPAYSRSGTALSEPAGGARRSPHERPASFTSVHGVHSYVGQLNTNLPAEIVKYQRLREQYQRQYDRLYRPYNGELGPQSYQPWQMEHYYIVRDIVEDEVEKFLDQFFREIPKGVTREAQLALIEADTKTWERKKDALSQSRIVQLAMEELVLETTSGLSFKTADEFLQTLLLIKNRVDRSFMKHAEVAATGDPKGRPPQDRAFNLVTKAFLSLQRDRNKYRKDLWGHTQHLHTTGEEAEEERKKQKKIVPFITSEKDDDDTIVIDFHHVTPVDMKRVDPKRTDTKQEIRKKEKYERYYKYDLQYWMNMEPSVKTIPLAKKCNGVRTAKASPNHQMLAVGSVHGDVIVYDLWTDPWRPLYAVHNQSNINDSIVNISWSLDSTRLITVNQSGVMRLWSLHGGDVQRTDLKGLGLKADVNGVFTGQLWELLLLDVDNFDFRFQTGPFADMGAQSDTYGPTVAAFHPSMTLLGTQHSFCVALENGDVLKCNTERALHDDGQQTYEETPRILYPNILNESSETSLIGQGIQAELFRQHKREIMHIGFIDNRRDLVTVDIKGYINIWKYTRSHFEWYKPLFKLKLDMSKIMYTPSDTRANVVFTDKKKEGRQGRVRTRQEIAQDRARAMATIDTLGLGDPWHEDYIDAQDIMTSIYTPRGEITESGAMFHIIMKHYSTDILSTYITRIYKPVKVKSTRLLCLQQTPDGAEVIFLLLFPEYAPKKAHISIVVLDLHTFRMKDFRRDIQLSDTLYSQCLYEDIVWADVSRNFGPTGAAYLFLNLAGKLSAYNLITGMKVMLMEEPTTPPAFIGSRVPFGMLSVPTYGEFVVACTLQTIYIIIYAVGQKGSKKHNQLTVLQLTDYNSDDDRRLMWRAFNTMDDYPPVPAIEQRINTEDHSLHNQLHPGPAMREIIMELLDTVVQQKKGEFKPETQEAHDELDRVRNYTWLKPQVDERRSPDPEPDINDQDPLAGRPPTRAPRPSRPPTQQQGPS